MPDRCTSEYERLIARMGSQFPYRQDIVVGIGSAGPATRGAPCAVGTRPLNPVEKWFIRMIARAQADWLPSGGRQSP